MRYLLYNRQESKAQCMSIGCIADQLCATAVTIYGYEMKRGHCDVYWAELYEKLIVYLPSLGNFKMVTKNIQASVQVAISIHK